MSKQGSMTQRYPTNATTTPGDTKKIQEMSVSAVCFKNSIAIKEK